MDFQSPPMPKDSFNLTNEENRQWSKWYQEYRRYVLKIQKEYRPNFKHKKQYYKR